MLSNVTQTRNHVICDIGLGTIELSKINMDGINSINIKQEDQIICFGPESIEDMILALQIARTKQPIILEDIDDATDQM